MKFSTLSLSLFGLIGSASAFIVPLSRPVSFRRAAVLLFADSKEEENPYADENYPDLEFINYDDPEYVVDQGDVFRGEDDTDEQIEAMREDRRRRNDEYQFETYFKNVLLGGNQEWKGEFTIYQTSTFSNDKKTLDENGLPRMSKVSPSAVKVTSVGSKVHVETDSDWRVDAQRICHEETAQDGTRMSTYWPDLMSSYEFRGVQGNMCVGNAYSICTAVPLLDMGGLDTDGPFGDMRTEVGIFDNGMRFRVKFEYSVKDVDRQTLVGVPPPMHLKTMTVCRETVDQWPDEANAPELFQRTGAPGGLYDPPPVGDTVQASKYMVLDLDGGATVLFPYQLDQDPRAFKGNGWVTSLDWTPGAIRYQVDRKVNGGEKMLGLRTLELSEVQGSQADLWRPKDGGQDMRQ
jgi:hypothetical protein